MDVLKTNPADAPGIKTVLNPDTLDKIRSDLVRWYPVFESSAFVLEGNCGKKWFVSLKKFKLGSSLPAGSRVMYGLYTKRSSFSVRICFDVSNQKFIAKCGQNCQTSIQSNTVDCSMHLQGPQQRPQLRSHAW